MTNRLAEDSICSMSFSSSLLMLLWIIRVEFISDWLEPWFIFVVMLFSKESIKTMISAKRQITLTKIIIERFLYFLILSPWLSSNFAMILSQLASSCNLRYWNPEISTDNALYTLPLKTTEPENRVPLLPVLHFSILSS